MKKKISLVALLEYKLEYREELKRIDKEAEKMIQNNDIGWNNMFM